MRIVKYIQAGLFAVFGILSFGSKGLAEQNNNSGYFDFRLSDNLLRDGQEIRVAFVWDIKGFDMSDQRRLTVKPFMSGGAVEIFNEELNRYIGVTDLNSTLPYLRKEMVLKFSGVQSSQNPLSLYFTIYDTAVGKRYSTPTKKVWGMAYYKTYTELLNENSLRDYAVSAGLSGEGPVDLAKGTDRSQDPVKFYLWYLSPAFFVFGLLKSPHGFG